MDHSTKQFLSLYWRDLGGVVSDRLREALSQDDYPMIAKILTTVAPRKYAEPYRFRRARLATDIIKKADYLPLDIDREYACLSKWVEAELLCRNQNHLFSLLQIGNHSKVDPSFERLMRRAKSFIRRVLGAAPDVEPIMGEFGPGATLSNSRAKSAAIYKLQQTAPTVTSEALWFIPALPYHARRAWRDCNEATVVLANRLTTVPKSFKTNRAIAVEPLVNAYCQRALGLQIKNRLRRFGIDLSIAPEHHKALACQASKDASWATLDLSSASDTLSKELVRYLLPRDWYRVLDYARCKYTDYSQCAEMYWDLFNDLKQGPEPGTVELEKFSSMGNGATFELETLIFFAICTAVVGNHQKVRVFGDDIIVPSVSACEVMTVLQQAGFVLNGEKSFFSGNFRESCGGDFASGVPVKGITLKTEPSCTEDWFDLHNRIWLASKDMCLDMSRTLHFIRQQVPRHLRLGIPVGLSGGFFTENPKPKVKDGILYYKCYIPVAKYKTLRDFHPDAILAAALLGKLYSGSRRGQPFEGFGIESTSRACKWVPLS